MIQVAENWFIRKPPVFRYLKQEYVTAFFDTGALRLSSFKAFSRHADEQRQDHGEGKTLLIATEKSGRGGTHISHMQSGLNAYVMSGSLRMGAELADAFGSNCGLRINDPTGFGREIAKHLPGRAIGMEGYCFYQDRRVSIRKVDRLDRSEYMVEGENPTVDVAKLTAMDVRILGPDAYFLKEVKYERQHEYRLIWQLEGVTEEYIDILAPNARQYCEPFKILGEK